MTARPVPSHAELAAEAAELTDAELLQLARPLILAVGDHARAQAMPHGCVYDAPGVAYARSRALAGADDRLAAAWSLVELQLETSTERARYAAIGPELAEVTARLLGVVLAHADPSALAAARGLIDRAAELLAQCGKLRQPEIVTVEVRA